jgi:hypothetical protein
MSLVQAHLLEMSYIGCQMGPCVRLVGKDRPLPMPSFRSQMLGLATFESNVSTNLSIFVADEPGRGMFYTQKFLLQFV